jgi:hypothetical protein
MNPERPVRSAVVRFVDPDLGTARTDELERVLFDTGLTGRGIRPDRSETDARRSL